MNELNLNSIYQKIAQTINETIPEKWSKVLMYGEIGEGTGTAFFFYYPINNENPCYSHDIPEMYNVSEEEYDKLWYQLLDELKELLAEFKNNNQNLWSNLTFTLESTGKYKIEYDYEDLSEADDHERRIIWEYNRLNLLPESEYDKSILEEYLRKKNEDVE